MDLAAQGIEVPASPCLSFFLKQEVNLQQLEQDNDYLKHYIALDDIDIWGAVKQWIHHPDKVLSELSCRLLERRLFRIKLSNEPIKEKEIEALAKLVLDTLKISKRDLKYFMVHGSISNAAYVSSGQKINIITKEGKIFDIAQASDLPNIKAMSKIVKKYYLCWPKDVNLRHNSIAYS